MSGWLTPKLVSTEKLCGILSSSTVLKTARWSVLGVKNNNPDSASPRYGQQRVVPGLQNEWLVDAKTREHSKVMRDTVEQHCAPNCTLVRRACTTCKTQDAHPWKQGSRVLCPHMRIVYADTKHSMQGLWQVSRSLE